jgi:hypothetical protein
MGSLSTRIMEASNNASMWTLWQHVSGGPRPSWDTFQKDFRSANPGLASDGHLNRGATYYVPTYDPPPSEPGPAAPPPGANQTNPGEPLPPGQADGSSPASAIPVTAPEAWKALGWDGVVDAVRPDAFVIAARGTIGVQDIPGWDKIPGLKNLGKDQKVGFLLATLTPMSPEGLNPNFKVKDTTVFLSLTVPGAPAPYVFTAKASDLTVEGGLAKNNPQPFKSVAGGDIILFSNARIGASGGDPGAVASLNGGVIFKLGTAKQIEGSVRDLIKTLSRTAEAAEVAGGVVGAPETEGGSLFGTAGSVFGTEMLKGTINNALDGVDWYAGFAWRADARMPIKEDGTVTLQVTKRGVFQDKWIAFNVKDIADDMLGLNVPDFKNPNRQWLINAGVKPEIADVIAPNFPWHDIGPLFDQTAAFQGVSRETLVDWFNQQSPDWVWQLASQRLQYMSPDENGTYPERIVDGHGGKVPVTSRGHSTGIEELVDSAALSGHPMPVGQG